MASDKQQRRDNFLAVWPGIRDELVSYMEGEKMPTDATAWYKKVLLAFFLLVYRP